VSRNIRKGCAARLRRPEARRTLSLCRHTRRRWPPPTKFFLLWRPCALGSSFSRHQTAVCPRSPREWATIHSNFERWGRFSCCRDTNCRRGGKGARRLAGPTAHYSNTGMTGASWAAFPWTRSTAQKCSCAMWSPCTGQDFHARDFRLGTSQEAGSCRLGVALSRAPTRCRVWWRVASFQLGGTAMTLDGNKIKLAEPWLRASTDVHLVYRLIFLFITESSVEG